jgi:hypothetical protein
MHTRERKQGKRRGWRRRQHRGKKETNVFKKSSDSIDGWKSNDGVRRLEERMEWSSCGSISNRGTDGALFVVCVAGTTKTMRIGESVGTVTRIET